jgi:Caspase domain
VRQAALAFAMSLVSAATALEGGVARAASTEAPERLAVVVGANGAPPGRRALRYAHEDARRVADVLTQLAGFDPGAVALLLDPTPKALLGALDRMLVRAGQSRRDAILLFYYSGHADDGVFYPGGVPLPLSALKPRLDDGRAKVRIGLVDACRGGGWTGTKGLVPGEPFDVEMPMGLSNQGSILIASSSGGENAHESENLRGSFFTHHWNAGLRGAADRNGDGLISVAEVFDYARTLTVRDSALVAPAPQHPSFRMNLGGRQELTLVTLTPRRRILVLEQMKGPLELVHLDSGLVVLESAAGARQVRLGVAKGRYLVRRRDPAGTWAGEVEVPKDGEVVFREQSLALVKPTFLGSKGMAAATATLLVPPGRWEVGLVVGVRHARVIDPGVRYVSGAGDLAGVFRAVHGLAPRWQLALPLALAYEGGAPDGWQWSPWAGLPALGTSHTEAAGAVATVVVGAGLDVGRAVSTRVKLGASAALLGIYDWTLGPPPACDASSNGCPSPPPRRGSELAQAAAGLSFRPVDGVSLGFGLSLASTLHTAGAAVGSDRIVAVGSVLRQGLRPQPLVRVQLGEALTLDLHVVVSYAFATGTLAETYLGGASFEF